MTPAQIKLIHVASGKAGFSRAQYETLLRNVGGVETSKDLTNETFEDCMAVLEDMGYRPFEGADYWRSKVRSRGGQATARLVWKIQQLHADYEAQRDVDAPRHYELAGLVSNASRGRTRDAAALLPREAWNLIEQLKSMLARHDPGNGPRSPTTAHAAGRILPFFAESQTSSMEASNGT
jgi:hypothetical protein